ncbi:hypothetical protein NPIL_170281 [Nephila pilipes]|uniref:Uncharacterized protein n=1 Tax=Nephila pilipes TaxID=299642 RepID=A0A8X6TXP7_NEPPI|nr:hypothetical protein NPIL_170281 [Nephila pilipes]
MKYVEGRHDISHHATDIDHYSPCKSGVVVNLSMTSLIVPYGKIQKSVELVTELKIEELYFTSLVDYPSWESGLMLNEINPMRR